MQIALPVVSDVIQHGGLFFSVHVSQSKRTVTEIDKAPESSIHPCTPPPSLYVLGIRNIASILAPPPPPPPPCTS